MSKSILYKLDGFEDHYWENPVLFPNDPANFTCGYCNVFNSVYVGIRLMEKGGAPLGGGKGIFLCNSCKKPTFVDVDKTQYPNPLEFNDIKYLKDEKLINLWLESRRAYQANCTHACIMVCRKILLNVAYLESGEDKSVIKNFAKAVDFLDDNGYTPKNSKKWIDKIRTIGNDANHKIKEFDRTDARVILGFVEAILKYIYEYPGSYDEFIKKDSPSS